MANNEISIGQVKFKLEKCLPCIVDVLKNICTDINQPKPKKEINKLMQIASIGIETCNLITMSIMYIEEIAKTGQIQNLIEKESKIINSLIEALLAQSDFLNNQCANRESLNEAYDIANNCFVIIGIIGRMTFKLDTPYPSRFINSHEYKSPFPWMDKNYSKLKRD